MKLVIRLVFIIMPFLGLSQDFTEQWTGFYSYFNIKAISEAEDRVFAAADNAVLIYDIAADTTSTISSVNGLSGQPITTIHYSEAFQTLVIGYENGLIEVVQDDSDNILSAVDIIEEISISPADKRINHFMEQDGLLYVSTGFGIVEYDLENLEFGDTFRIGENGAELQVKQTATDGNLIYAATVGGGLRYADINSPDLINFEEWQPVTGSSPNSSFDAVESVAEQIYAINTNQQVSSVNGTSLQTVGTLSLPVNSLRSYQEQLFLTTQEEVRVYDSNFTLITTITQLEDITQDYITASVINDQIYIGHNTEGLLRTSSTALPTFEVLSPDGPLRNGVFNMEATANELWVVFGGYNIFYNPTPRTEFGVSHLIEEDWRNIPYDSLMEMNNIVEVTINPTNTSEVYLSSYGRGLLRVVDNEADFLFDETNSSLDIGASTNLRINGTAFDNQGNLWIGNTFSETALQVLRPGGTIEPVDISEVVTTIGEGNIGKLAIDRNNNIYAGSRDQGLVGYQPSSGTIAQLRDDVGGAGLPDNDLRALEFDLNNRLWIGATSGLRILFNPQSIFTENDVTVDPIIIEENGVAQELLFSQFISDIETDGSNNKWIGTAASGVFYLSANGQETLLRFTTDNSPLPSNNITGIEIDEATGRVYISTVNGLLAYSSTATSAQDNLEEVRAYPNPVRPGFAGNVIIDGLTANANVKITDITGNLVYEDTSVGGTIEWDTTAFGRHRVASGVYLILITAEDVSETKVHKLLIVR